MAAPPTRWLRPVQMGSAVFLVFLGGMMVASFHVFPDRVVRPMLLDLRALYRQATGGHIDHPPIRFPGVQGVTINVPGRSASGVTLLTSHWEGADHRWSPGIRVIDAAGKTLHHWTVKPMEIWPARPYADPFIGPSATADIHGAYLFPNGDVLFNLEYLGLQRVDACGKLVWKLAHRTHHSVSRDDDGTFWVSAGKRFESTAAQRREFPALSPPFLEETALQVSPDGKILREVDLLKPLLDSPSGDVITRNRGDWLRSRRSQPVDTDTDTTHMNDVEALPAALAAKFPMFEPGDLLVSMREISTVFVVDRQGRRIKWIDTEDFLRQHDPDFEPDGSIVVLDNRSDNTEDGLGALHGSRIAAIDPATRAVRTLYPGPNSSGTPRFYTSWAGTHQLLPNGNRLIAETRAGRAFEVTPSGEIVWQWVQQPHDAETVPEIMEATRYDISEATIRSWPCSPPK